MFHFLKVWAKKLPGIRYVVEGRDRFIALYSEQLEKNTALTAQLSAAEHGLTQQKEQLAAVQAQLEESRQAVTRGQAMLEQMHRDAEESARLSAQQRSALLDRDKTIAELESRLRQYDYQARSDALDSGTFWNEHYLAQGTSGSGSYHRLAAFKAEILKAFLQAAKIKATIELGCGDGNQLRLTSYRDYTGIDVSEVVIQKDREQFAQMPNYRFYCSLTQRSEYIGRKYDLALSMDVIFHLLEQSVFEAYMKDLFSLSERYVVIYSSNHEAYTPWPEFRHRNFTGYVQEHFPQWELIKFIPNRYPYRIGQEEDTSMSDFYFYKKNPPDT